MEKFLPKLDLNAPPGPSGFWNGYLRLWTGVFAPSSAEEAREYLETLIIDMANDITLSWFMQAMKTTDLIAIVKDSPAQGILADQRPVGIPNALSKITDNAIFQQFQTDYVKALMPQQLGIGV